MQDEVIQHGVSPFLECSSRGDARFSAFSAKIKGRDNRSIEEIYQAAKILPDGSTGHTPKQVKGVRPVNIVEVAALYSILWEEYIVENPHLLLVLVTASGLSDRFGQVGHACQATELWRIRLAYVDPTTPDAP